MEVARKGGQHATVRVPLQRVGQLGVPGEQQLQQVPLDAVVTNRPR